MWGLVISVWLIVDGNMQRFDYLANREFSTQVECTTEGANGVRLFLDRHPEIVGAAFICAQEEEDRPDRRGELQA